MEVLKKSREVFIAIWVCEYQVGTTWSKKVLCALFGFSLFASNTFSCVTSLIFAARNINVDFSSTIYATFQAAATVTASFASADAFFYRSEMAAVFVKYNEFYEKSMSILTVISIEYFS